MLKSMNSFFSSFYMDGLVFYPLVLRHELLTVSRTKAFIIFLGLSIPLPYSIPNSLANNLVPVGITCTLASKLIVLNTFTAQFTNVNYANYKKQANVLLL